MPQCNCALILLVSQAKANISIISNSFNIVKHISDSSGCVNCSCGQCVLQSVMTNIVLKLISTAKALKIMSVVVEVTESHVLVECDGCLVASDDYGAMCDAGTHTHTQYEP